MFDRMPLAVDRWYRNAGRGKYHKTTRDWVRSGLAVCGADIGRAGFTAKAGELDRIPHTKICRHCTRQARKGYVNV
jgi:hypothetical protein